MTALSSAGRGSGVLNHESDFPRGPSVQVTSPVFPGDGPFVGVRRSPCGKSESWLCVWIFHKTPR